MLKALLQPMHLLLILCVTLLFFRPSKLKELGKRLGEAIRGLKEAGEDEHPGTTEADGSERSKS